MTRAAATVYGFIALVGIPLLGLLWLISVTPPVVWAFLGVLLVCFVLVALPTGDLGVVFSKDPEEAKRKTRVSFLQHQVSRLKTDVFATRNAIWDAGSSVHGGSRIHEIPPLERRLAEQESELAKARQELNTIWKKSDGAPFGGWGRGF